MALQPLAVMVSVLTQSVIPKIVVLVVKRAKLVSVAAMENVLTQPVIPEIAVVATISVAKRQNKN